MFTGLVQGKATVTAVTAKDSGRRLTLLLEDVALAESLERGSSIALNGACMSLVAEPLVLAEGLSFAVDVSPESLAKTNLALVGVGSMLHFELPLRAGGLLGGHIVSGHVDGFVTLVASQSGGEFVFWELEVGGAVRDLVAPYLVQKGSVTLDGVSLTVNFVSDHLGVTRFGVCLIPETMKVTNFSSLGVGSKLNVEADMLAKYAARRSEYQNVKASEAQSG